MLVWESDRSVSVVRCNVVWIFIGVYEGNWLKNKLTWGEEDIFVTHQGIFKTKNIMVRQKRSCVQKVSDIHLSIHLLSLFHFRVVEAGAIVVFSRWKSSCGWSPGFLLLSRHTSCLTSQWPAPVSTLCQIVCYVWVFNRLFHGFLVIF